MAIRVIITIIINMANIILIKPNDKTVLVYAAYIIFLSGILISLSVPRLIASLSYLPVQKTVLKLTQQPILPDSFIQSMIVRVRYSLQWQNDPNYWRDLSRLVFYQVRFQGLTINLLLATRHSIRQSLMRSPANAFLWYQAAVIDFLLQSSPNQIKQELVLSILTGPYALSYLLPRLKLCLQLLPFFNSTEQHLIRQQLLTAWALSPELCLNLIKMKGISRNNVRFLLHQTDPDILATMEHALEKNAP
jgi:hypothetical protein